MYYSLFCDKWEPHPLNKIGLIEDLYDWFIYQSFMISVTFIYCRILKQRVCIVWRGGCKKECLGDWKAFVPGLVTLNTQNNIFEVW